MRVTPCLTNVVAFSWVGPPQSRRRRARQISRRAHIGTRPIRGTISRSSDEPGGRVERSSASTTPTRARPRSRPRPIWNTLPYAEYLYVIVSLTGVPVAAEVRAYRLVSERFERVDLVVTEV